MKVIDSLYLYLRKRKLLKLQKVISPQVESNDDMMSSLLSNKGEDALLEYVDLCVVNPEISEILTRNKLSRNDLKEIYYELLSGSAGGWYRGHYTPLSTLAEPKILNHFLNLKSKGAGVFDLSKEVRDFWVKNKF